MYVSDNGINFEVALVFEEINLIAKKYDNIIRFYANFIEYSSSGYLGEHIFLAEFDEINFMLTINGKNKISVVSIKNYYNEVVNLLNENIKSVEDLFESFIVNNFREKFQKVENGIFIGELFELFFLGDIFNKYNKR